MNKKKLRRKKESDDDALACMSEPLVRVVRGQCKAARDRGSKWLLYSSLWYSIVHPKSTSPTAAAAAHSTVRENRAGGTSVGRSKKAPLMDGRGTYSTAQHRSPFTTHAQRPELLYCTNGTSSRAICCHPRVGVCVWNGRARTNLPKSAQHSPLLFQQQSLLVVLYCSMPFSR
jgi:hypothetical protein